MVFEAGNIAVSAGVHNSLQYASRILSKIGLRLTDVFGNILSVIERSELLDFFWIIRLYPEELKIP